MKSKLEKLKEDFTEEIKRIANSKQLHELKVKFLGRKGLLAEIMKELPKVAAESRKEIGTLANSVKKYIESEFEKTLTNIERQERSQREEAEWIDITLPGTRPQEGHLHLITQTIFEIDRLFARLGFVSVRHPEVEWDLYAFESLNMQKDHPARDEWETFFISAPGEDEIFEGEKGKMVLTPHTSNGQPREMARKRMPIRMININKCYRRQADISHTPMFHQFEGLMIDEKVTVAELKGVLEFFAHNFFGRDRKIRLRPHHFPFTEPSFEIDISCGLCGGEGRVNGEKCRMCKEGWLELGGAGMVHPNVLKAGGLDPDKYSGFAFGWGIERVAMMKPGMNIKDMRIMYKNDLRFLQQF
ncbi:phenylalanine--tRNA ligase subunit alpha [Candidatus Parcubacteria bacterium]|nr:MAG: phenylalanine--tRNA ligase subunit alpha [Candidatus Parcubacteria bacterium]